MFGGGGGGGSGRNIRNGILNTNGMVKLRVVTRHGMRIISGIYIRNPTMVIDSMAQIHHEDTSRRLGDAIEPCRYERVDRYMSIIGIDT